MSQLKEFWKTFKDTIHSFGEHHLETHAAALAYYTIFAAAPLVLIAVAVIGIFLGDERTSDVVYGAIADLVGESTADTIQSAAETTSARQTSVIATIVGLFTLLIGATTVFGQLQDSLNRIWNVHRIKGSSFRRTLRQRTVSFSMVLIIAFLLLLSFLASATLSWFEKFAGGVIPGGNTVWELANMGLSFAMASVLFAAIYKVLPDVELSWRDVRSGGIVTAFFFTIGKFAVGLYLGKSAPGSAFGAAGAIVVLLVWTHAASAILLFGAAFTQIRATRSQVGLRPKTGAEWLSLEKSLPQGPGLRRQPLGKPEDSRTASHHKSGA